MTRLWNAIDAIDTETRIESFTSGASLWDGWATVTILVLVLAAEWWLRKRSNLL